MPVRGYEGLYEVSRRGELRRTNLNKGKLIALSVDNRGYHVAYLYKKGIRKRMFMHKVVVESFRGNKISFQIIHVDKNKSNNHLSNLRFKV